MSKNLSYNAELSAKIQQGIQLSVDRLIQRNAAESKSVAIGDIKGNVKVVLATELLQAKKIGK